VAGSARHGEGRTLAVVGHGFIGRRVARTALARGWQVRSLTRRPDDQGSLPGVELVVGDARDPGVQLKLLTGTDHVVFAAGTAKPAESNDHPAHEVRANEETLLVTLDVMTRTATPAITLLSSGGTVYGPDAPTPTPESAPVWPNSAYGVVKLASERHVARHAREYGVAADILRVANVYGPGEPTQGSQGLLGIARAALCAGRPVVVYGDGSARRDFVHVDDVAEAVVALAAHPAGVRVLNVGSGRSVSVLEAVEAVARSLGTEAAVDHRPGRPTDVPVVELDISALQRTIDFEPRGLAEGLAPDPTV